MKNFQDANSHGGVDGGATALNTQYAIKKTRNLRLNEKGLSDLIKLQKFEGK